MLGRRLLVGVTTLRAWSRAGAPAPPAQVSPEPLLGWASFRPTEEQRGAGARSFRCDVVAGSKESAEPPAHARAVKGALLGRPDDRRMAWGNGDRYPPDEFGYAYVREPEAGVGAGAGQPPFRVLGEDRAVSVARRAAGALAALLVCLAGCTDDSPDAAEPSPTDLSSQSAGPTSAPAPPPPPPPRVGACYRLTLAQATAPTSGADPVPCRRDHTARTIHVGRLATVVDGHAVAVDSARVQRQLARTCPARFAGFVGGTPEARRLSRLQVVWFSPTLEQADAGADWFRCDVLAVGNDDELLPLPRRGSLREVLDRPGALGTYGLCGTARPGTPGFTRVACALPHSWVAIATLPIPGGGRFPGAPAVRASGDEACSERVRSEAGFPLEFSYGWEWPTRRQWAAGQRYGFCWAPA